MNDDAVSAGSSTPEELAAVEIMALAIKDDAELRWGHYLPPLNLANYRTLASRAYNALREAGVLTPPADEYEQTGWLLCTDGSYFSVVDDRHSGRCPDCVPVFVRRSAVEGSEDTQ